METYTVVSKVGYLVGVPKQFFESEREPLQLEWYCTLENNKAARTIRHLCIVRTAIERHFKAISEAMRFDLKSIYSLPEFIPQESIKQLNLDGITLKKKKCLFEYIVELNRYISDRINNCKDVFPAWLKWEYIRDIFIMPNGFTEEGTKEAAKKYYMNRYSYPYSVFINWNYPPSGNIFWNDKKFVTLLYESQEDHFTDLSKVSDADQIVKSGVYDFLERSIKTAMVVDCENADPYKLYATLNNLNENALLDKIAKIILYNDVHAPTAWKLLERFVNIPIEHNMINRVKEDKSLVDIRLTTGTCREFFQNQIDSFVLVSSDSDYWGMISAMPEARFLVLIESGNCSPALKRAMEERQITYCYMDDFCTGNSEEMRIQAVLHEVRQMMNKLVNFNINDILQTAYSLTRANMDDTEKKRVYDKYIKSMRLVIGKDGTVKVELGPFY